MRALSGNNAVRSSNSQPGGGSIEFVESSIEVSASVEECFQVASGFEDYVKWAESVPKVEVLEKNEQGLGERVALRLGALGFTLDYVLMYEYDQPRQMRWNAVGGKVTTPLGTVVPFEGANDNGSSQLIGSYTFEEVRPGVTKVVYKLAIEYGFPFPKAVKEQSEQQIVSVALAELKRYTEAPGTKAQLRQAALRSAAAASTMPPPDRTDRPPTSPDLKPRQSGPGGNGGGPSGRSREERERETLKEELFSALQTLDRGFEASASDQKNVAAIVQRLSALSPEAAPAPKLLSVDSKWRLIYSDAPDIVGPTAAGRGRIGQRVEATNSRIGLLSFLSHAALQCSSPTFPRNHHTSKPSFQTAHSPRTVLHQCFKALVTHCTHLLADMVAVNLVEALPPSPLQSLPFPPPSLQLEVTLGAEAVSDTEVRLSLLGTSAAPGSPKLPFPTPSLGLPLLFPLPFGSFSILYYDGDLRVIKTAQGYLGINMREQAEK